EHLAVDHEDHFGRHPPAAEFLILVELRLLRLRSILTGGTQHADEVKILLIDPELRRMKIARLSADDIDWSSLPRVLPKLREIKLQRLQFRGDVGGRCAIDVKPEDQQRVFEGTRSVDLAVF